MHDALGAFKREIIHHGAVDIHGLRSHARGARQRVVNAQLRYVPLQCFHERTSHWVAVRLAYADGQVFSGELDEPGIRERFEELARVDGCEGIAFAREREHGVRSEPNIAVQTGREMRAQKWERRVRYGVDVAANEVPLSGF